ncbi:MAG: hypothetical protein UT64_C0033G0011 [Candidatus Falkowbacteria bacterium GW2011_GWF2_39_8]|uniref:CBS domain-containing protein n=1 Tax=Candidatus Falkowbacteria bacterium GW2011_GWF2_39_8 TaxID=1618642 RepID=A0A0G0T3Q9_9BACT|nr:MAG: hypothetical protein UT64_C0033G0011 [Candidatus Falkowbacteria bacterium GW2011_GWF2_39_8]
MRNLKVKDIMVKKVFSAGVDDSVLKIARVLEKKKIHAMPVVDKKNKVVGIIAETDFYLKNGLDFHIPTYINFIKQSNFHKADKIKESPEAQAIFLAKVSDIMTSDCFVIPDSLEIKELLEIFKSRKLYTIPVVNKTNSLIGIVTIADIIKLL